MIPPLQLHRPRTLPEAVALLADLGDEARIHAGGTELVLLLREGFLRAAHLVDIKGVPELAGIRADAGAGLLHLGATARHDDLARSPVVDRHLPVLARLEGRLANQRVRNAGTIGGNLAFAEPHADPPALLVAAEAELRLESTAGSRVIPLERFIRGAFDVDLEAGEILGEIRVAIPGARTAFGYRRFKALERPSVTAAVRLSVANDGRLQDVRVVLGCLGGPPQVMTRAAQLLAGLSLADLARALDDVAAAIVADAETVTDAHGPEEYKRHMAGVLATRALRDAGGSLAGDPAR
jgi:carbon-monoxide dehydrogenase medium subunit